MRVLIADKLSAATTEALMQLGIDVDYQPDLSTEQLASALDGINVLVVRSTKVDGETIQAAKALSLIVRAGAGVNTIDVEQASRKGVYVTNCPGRNSAAVAELAWGLILACDRDLVNAARDLRDGKWLKKKYGAGYGLRGRVLGLLGMGMIGQAVARIAQGFEMEVVAWSRSLDDPSAKRWGVRRCATPLEVAQQADVVSIHLAATPETRHLVNAAWLSALRPGAILVNTSRGDLVDTQALSEAIEHRGLKVGLDVFEDEPKGGEAPFEQAELAQRICGTPHIGASTEEASEAIANEVVRIIREFRSTGKPPNTVNMCQRSSATHSLVVRHLNQVGVLAGVLDLLKQEGINVEEMENTVFDGARAACCTLQLDQAPSETLRSQLEEQPAILQVTLERR